MVSYRLIGTGTTNEQGIARCSNNYVGTGKGEVDLIASTDNPIVEGSLLSGTYEIEDTIAYDLCIDNSHSSQWQHSDSNEVTVDNTGMLINHNTTGLSTNTFKTPSANSNFCYTTPVMVEFDVVSVTSQVRVQFYDNTNLISLKLSEINAVAGSHVKLVMDNNSKICIAYVNDVQKLIRGTDTGTALSDYTFRFRLEDNSAFKFKNLKIYNTDSEDYAFFYDEATSSNSNSNWDMKQASISRQSTYTELTGSTTVFQSKSITDNVLIEFDYYCTSTSENAISVRSDGNPVWQRTLTQLGVSANTWCHVKIKLEDGQYWLWVDGTDKTGATHTIPSFNRFFFRVSDSYSVRYKNYIIYSL